LAPDNKVETSGQRGMRNTEEVGGGIGLSLEAKLKLFAPIPNMSAIQLCM